MRRLIRISSVSFVALASRLVVVALAAGVVAGGGCARGATPTPSSDGGQPLVLVARAADAAIGCHDNAGCAPDQYCVFQPGLCGKGEKPGVCRAKPAACHDAGAAYAPVCGCDRTIYDNECAARAAGVDLAVMGKCGGRMPDWIPCGKQFCNARRDYCAIYLSDVFELPTDYFCRPLPAACRPGDGGVRPTCDCFPADTACRSFCGPMVTDGVSGFHLTCQGVTPPK